MNRLNNLASAEIRWNWIRCGILLASLMYSIWEGPYKIRANPPMTPLYVLVIFIFPLFIVPIMLWMQRFFNTHQQPWKRISWSRNPFSLVESIHSFHFSAIVGLVCSSYTLLVTVIYSRQFFWDSAAIFAFSAGALLGINTFQQLFPHAFEATE